MEGLRQFVVFNMENEDYGIDIADIHEIDRPKEITIYKFPKAPDYVVGIINLRGEIVPIINLRKRFNLPNKEIDRDSRIIIVKLGKKMTGLVVDKVAKAVELMPEEISTTPEEMPVSGLYVKSVGKKDSQIITILDIKAILNTSGN